MKINILIIILFISIQLFSSNMLLHSKVAERIFDEIFEEYTSIPITDGCQPMGTVLL